jgi:hypothetical protein
VVCGIFRHLSIFSLFGFVVSDTKTSVMFDAKTDGLA